MTAHFSKTAHTPGPWKFVVDRDGLIYRLCGDGMWFAKLSWTVTGDRNEADARLITAAPDMLEALRAVVSVADRDTVEFRLARAAIAKAAA